MVSMENIIHQMESVRGPVTKLYFVQKLRNNYTSYAPNVTPQIYSELLILIKTHLQSYTNHTLVEFNPTGQLDATIEHCNTEYVGDYDEIIDSFSTPDTFDTSISPENLTFYCLEFTDRNETFKLRFFRRVTKFKKLSSKGIIACFSGETLNKIDPKVIGIDGFVDLICADDDIYILNHIALERIFNLAEQFHEKATDALNILRPLHRISNFDKFEEDCLNDMRFKKILSKMLDESANMERVFSNFDNVRSVKEIFGLDIEILEGAEPSLKYEDKHQLMDFLRIIRDSYYKSIICEKEGIDDKI